MCGGKWESAEQQPLVGSFAAEVSSEEPDGADLQIRGHPDTGGEYGYLKSKLCSGEGHWVQANAPLKVVISSQNGNGLR